MISEVQPIGSNWWLFLVLGLVSIVAGILAIVYPDITLLALGLFVGISLLITGVLGIIEAIAGPPDERALNAVVGVLAVVAGLICIRRPGESLLALIVVLGIYLVVTGGITLVRAFTNLEDRALRFGLAIIDLVLGILILSLPELSLVTLAVLFGISLLVRGVFACLTAFRLRGARHAQPGAPAAA